MNTGLRMILRSLVIGAITVSVYSGGFDQPVEIAQSSKPEAVDTYVAEMLQAQVKEHKDCMPVSEWHKGDIPSSMLAYTGKIPNGGVVNRISFSLQSDQHVLAWCK